MLLVGLGLRTQSVPTCTCSRPDLETVAVALSGIINSLENGCSIVFACVLMEPD